MSGDKSLIQVTVVKSQDRFETESWKVIIYRVNKTGTTRALLLASYKITVIPTRNKNRINHY
ncbi:MAG TPA: hypothetical protein DDY13_14370 [Cytophagales bacterium]|nr:hypothetical protein [Cytophagales bacterium]